jgi:hypothetical protein
MNNSLNLKSQIATSSLKNSLIICKFLPKCRHVLANFQI